jgi:NTP pyrophosphatase (non-canonical NTP hydrolase)
MSDRASLLRLLREIGTASRTEDVSIAKEAIVKLFDAVREEMNNECDAIRARAEKVEAEYEALKNDPKYSYAGFPIPREAIVCRNKEIDQLRDQLANVTDRAMRNIMDERLKQDEKWGEQNHDPYTYLAILLEEVGEYAQACLQTQFGGKNGGFLKMREEAVQTAAVALAIVECLDRGKWEWHVAAVKG